MDAFVLDVLFRGAAIGAAIATGVAFWRGGAGHPVRLAGVLFAASVAAYAFNSSPSLPPVLPAHFLSFGGAGMFWLFVVTLFEDRAISPPTLAPWALLTVIGVIGSLVPAPAQSAIWVAHNLIEAFLALHALFIIARSSRGDLVEARRRLRGPFLTIVALFVLLLSAVEIGESLGLEAWWYVIADGAALAALCIAGAAVFLIARPELLGAATPAPPRDHLAPADRETLARLRAAMETGEAWRREGLTIGALAEEVGAPEHRLRRLINDHLGRRNFAAFVNVHRIEAAKRRLSDPKEALRSISAIAFDLGFGSLGPFNRAFKEATGLTPTEWRRDQSSPIPEIAG